MFASKCVVFSRCWKILDHLVMLKPLSTSPVGVEIIGKLNDGFDKILTPDALDFVTQLHSKFNDHRLDLLSKRQERRDQFEQRLSFEKIKFLKETADVRRDDKWTVFGLPNDLAMRRVEITGPVDKKMIINGLNSGADVYMADFEDATTPNWSNIINGQINLKSAVRRTLAYKSTDKEYKLNDKLATLMVRPRGWHLPEKYILIDGHRTSGSLVDFGLFFYHNAKELLSRGSGPYFYLPKLEHHLEARLWNDVFSFAEDHQQLPSGVTKATVLIETLPAAFQMDEILFELKDRSAGLNAGRWDYIFSCVKLFKNQPDFCLADRSLITMTVPFMKAYATHLVRTCHRRKTSAIGGMSALIPIKSDPVANEKALAGVRQDKAREAKDGFDGSWVAHPGLVDVAMEEFRKVLVDRPNQIYKQLDKVDEEQLAKALVDFGPKKPITEAGLKMNVSVGIRYIASWLDGIGCVPLNNLMEDAATAEISRSQVWLWINSMGVMDDGRRVTKELVKKIIRDELEVINKEQGTVMLNQRLAAEAFERLCNKRQFEEFLTLGLYECLL